MPAAGIESLVRRLPLLLLLLAFSLSGYSSFDFISVSLLRSVVCAWLCLLSRSPSFPLSLSIFGQLFRTAFAVGEEAEQEQEQPRGERVRGQGKGRATAWGNMCKFDS